MIKWEIVSENFKLYYTHGYKLKNKDKFIVQGFTMGVTIKSLKDIEEYEYIISKDEILLNTSLGIWIKGNIYEFCESLNDEIKRNEIMNSYEEVGIMENGIIWRNMGGYLGFKFKWAYKKKGDSILQTSNEQIKDIKDIKDIDEYKYILNENKIYMKKGRGSFFGVYIEKFLEIRNENFTFEELKDIDKYHEEFLMMEKKKREKSIEENFGCYDDYEYEVEDYIDPETTEIMQIIRNYEYDY